MKMAIGIDIGGKKIVADSILQLKEAVKNAVDWRIATPEEALYMASTASAKSIGIDGVCRFQAENLIGKEGVR
ncbi:hypothetical protein [Peribacillus butanolivorans]|uniref:hypothetical protein n=1 Tax=Peribacillus butanolivorans TaxID=421767 RepID=UPI003800729D